LCRIPDQNVEGLLAVIQDDLQQRQDQIVIREQQLHWAMIDQLQHEGSSTRELQRHRFLR
jgi:hypothetical protein